MDDMNENIGLGRCMTADNHGYAHGVVGVEHRDSREKVLVFLCVACVMAHTAAEMAAIVFGPSVPGIINALFARIGVQQDIGIEMIEAALETHPIGEHVEALRACLRDLRVREDATVTPISANDFAALMARDNTTNPKHEEIN